ncbi:transcription initiation factor tfiid subunit 6 [Anaeramoeba ignava]|uniref:Transcription initiation factor tfiid subunit 6 n=1 Tax=Anaeramoeba ignava TaxID=1746090 RepID=A0A9Q0LIN6_ANAIG|nr:transcription initiation factor tfiid subunit 6 [Anaeramoeba ignava]
MSDIFKNTIQNIANSQQIIIKDSSTQILASDLLFRITSIIEDAKKSMKHSKRRKLELQDIKTSFRIKKIESNLNSNFDFVPLLTSTNNRPLLVKDIINEPLQEYPIDSTLYIHWLSIEGVEPQIPENPIVENTKLQKFDYLNRVRKSSNIILGSKITGDGTHEIQVDVRQISSHSKITQELQILFDKIIQTYFSNSKEEKESILFLLANDSSIQPILIYLIDFIEENVKQNVKNIENLYILMKMLRSFIRNKAIKLDKISLRILPLIITCLINANIKSTKSLLYSDFCLLCSRTLSQLFLSILDQNNKIKARISNVFLSVLLNSHSSFRSLYGSLLGIASLDLESIRLVILPHIQILTLKFINHYIQFNHFNFSWKYQAFYCFHLLVSSIGSYYLVFTLDLDWQKNSKKNSNLKFQKQNLLLNEKKEIEKDSYKNESLIFTFLGESFIPFFYSPNLHLCDSLI